MSDLASFGLELYAASCELDGPFCYDSWQSRFGEDWQRRSGTVQQESFHPLTDVAVDDLLLTSDEERELYTRMSTEDDDGGPFLGIRLHDTSQRYGCGLAWVVCKQSVALEGVTTLLGQLSELGLIRLPVFQVLQEV